MLQVALWGVSLSTAPSLASPLRSAVAAAASLARGRAGGGAFVFASDIAVQLVDVQLLAAAKLGSLGWGALSAAAPSVASALAADLNSGGAGGTARASAVRMQLLGTSPPGNSSAPSSSTSSDWWDPAPAASAGSGALRVLFTVGGLGTVKGSAVAAEVANVSAAALTSVFRTRSTTSSLFGISATPGPLAAAHPASLLLCAPALLFNVSISISSLTGGGTAEALALLLLPGSSFDAALAPSLRGLGVTTLGGARLAGSPALLQPGPPAQPTGGPSVSTARRSTLLYLGVSLLGAVALASIGGVVAYCLRAARRRARARAVRVEREAEAASEAFSELPPALVFLPGSDEPCIAFQTLPFLEMERRQREAKAARDRRRARSARSAQQARERPARPARTFADATVWQSEVRDVEMADLGGQGWDAFEQQQVVDAEQRYPHLLDDGEEGLEMVAMSRDRDEGEDADPRPPGTHDHSHNR